MEHFRKPTNWLLSCLAHTSRVESRSRILQFSRLLLKIKNYPWNGIAVCTVVSLISRLLVEINCLLETTVVARVCGDLRALQFAVVVDLSNSNSARKFGDFKFSWGDIVPKKPYEQTCFSGFPVVENTHSCPQKLH